MILKEYQKRAVATVGDFVEGLARWRREDEAARKQNPDWGFDWVERAWRDTGLGRPYRARRTGVGDPLPAFCLKIPTGGGKTLLATRVIDLVNGRFLHRRRGLVLWIVPTTQIYNQTLGPSRIAIIPTGSSLTCCPASAPGCSRRRRRSVRGMSRRTSASSSSCFRPPTGRRRTGFGCTGTPGGSRGTRRTA